MITINLRPGQKRKRAGSPFAGVAGRAKALGARVKDPLLLAAAAAWMLPPAVRDPLLRERGDRILEERYRTLRVEP